MILHLILPVIFGAFLGALTGSFRAWWQRSWLPAVFGTSIGTAIGSLLIALYATRPELWAAHDVPVLLVIAAPALAIGYIASHLATRFWGALHTVEEGRAPSTAPTPANRIDLRPGWDARPRDEGEKGCFSGRAEVVDRLATAFSTPGSGTILISGVRGVGKTAVVDYAIGEARRRLDRRWREELPGLLNILPTWSLPDRFIVWWMAFGHQRSAVVAWTLARLEVLLRPMSRRVRNVNATARLLVLKFDAADIGASSDESQPASPNPAPRVSPEKLLRALIGKLHNKCHISRATEEALVLSDSFSNRRERRAFFDLLENAYRKSVTKNYKETLASTQNELLKRSRSSGFELSVNLLKLAAAYGPAVISAVAAAWVYSVNPNALPLPALIGVPLGFGVVAAWLTAKWTLKVTSDSSSDLGRQAKALYEFDYSLPQMETDLYELFRRIVLAKSLLQPGFERILLVFDELDKLEEALDGLKAVINHFKNLFTLSDALFVFITDQKFFEEVLARIQAAGNRGQYAPEHTFFTQRIYIRKPDFREFQLNVYGICNLVTLRRHVWGGTSDEELIDYCLDPINRYLLPGAPLLGPEVVRGLLRRARSMSGPEWERVYESFRALAKSNAPVFAKGWTDLLAAGVPDDAVGNLAQLFIEANGWNNPDAIAHLYFFRSRFSQDERDQIETAFERLKPSLAPYTSLKSAPFNLTDAAKALCFKARNHYFDLYQAIYDYVGSYENGVPVLWIEEQTARLEHRQWARYQRMIEEAYKSGFDDETSREFFNEVLIESLYRVFDRRVRGELTEVQSLVVSRKNDSTKLLSQRDFDQINRAILYLLRLLAARNATARVDELFTAEELTNLDFIIEWREDFDSIITREGVALDEHEKALLAFWQARKADLTGFDTALAALWADAEMPSDATASVLRRHYAKLRAAAEGLDKLTTSVSVSHAERLRRETRSADELRSLIPLLLIERIRAEEGIQVFDASTLKDSSAAPSGTQKRMTDVQMLKVPLAAVAWIPEPDFLFYVVMGPYPMPRDWSAFRNTLQSGNAAFAWYVPEIRPANLEEYHSNGVFAFLDENPLPTLFAWLSQIARVKTTQELARRYAAKPEPALALRIGAFSLGRIDLNAAWVKVVSADSFSNSLTMLRDIGLSPALSHTAMEEILRILLPDTRPEIIAAAVSEPAISVFRNVVLSHDNSFAMGLVWMLLRVVASSNEDGLTGGALADAFVVKFSELAEQHRVSAASIHLAIGSWTKELEDFRKDLTKPRASASAA